MIVYQFREGDYVYVGSVDLPDAPFIPPYHTFEAPPARDGYYAVMRGGWVLVEGDVPAPPSFVEPEPFDYAAAVRAERDAKLAMSDWRVIRAYESGVPLTPEWSDYRQQLRDIPLQEDFPFNIVWPEPPAA